MRLRPLGDTGIQVSEMGLGTWELSGDVYGRKSDAVSVKAIHTALGEGVNLIDTAAGYGKGHSETVVAKALKQWSGSSSEIVIVTKVPPRCGTFAPPPEKNIVESYPPEWIVAQCEASLGRLQRDCIDVLLLHTWNPAWADQEAWYDAMRVLKRQGKIRAIGISITDEGIADANVHIEAGRVDVVECVYNVFQQEPEYTLFPLARKHGTGVIARSPLSSGALTGGWTETMQFEPGDWRGIWPKSVKPGWQEEQVRMAAAVTDALAAYGIPTLLGALKFVLMNDDVSSAIPGSSSPDHVRENLKAPSLPLPPACSDVLKQLWLKRLIHGTYNGSI